MNIKNLITLFLLSIAFLSSSVVFANDVQEYKALLEREKKLRSAVRCSGGLALMANLLSFGGVSFEDAARDLGGYKEEAELKQVRARIRALENR